MEAPPPGSGQNGANLLGSGNSVTPSDQERFKLALTQLQGHLLEVSRPDRYKPDENFALASVCFGVDGDFGAPSVGEILDVSLDGMKIALGVGPLLEAEQACRIVVQGQGQTYELLGRVRWVEASPFITVFGVALDQAAIHSGPAA